MEVLKIFDYNKAVRKRTHGFTLLEIMLVVAIITLIAAILMPNFLRLRMTAQDVAMEAEMKSIYKAMLVFYAMNGRFPQNYNELRPYIEVPGFDRKYQINPNPFGP